jgi:hypothetical protein
VFALALISLFVGGLACMDVNVETGLVFILIGLGLANPLPKAWSDRFVKFGIIGMSATAFVCYISSCTYTSSPFSSPISLPMQPIILRPQLVTTQPSVGAMPCKPLSPHSIIQSIISQCNSGTPQTHPLHFKAMSIPPAEPRKNYSAKYSGGKMTVSGALRFKMFPFCGEDGGCGECVFLFVFAYWM